jgi:hypothetical protein
MGLTVISIIWAQVFPPFQHSPKSQWFLTLSPTIRKIQAIFQVQGAHRAVGNL